jgi:phosphatidylserine decarboxylase
MAKEGFLFVLPLVILAAAAFSFERIWIGGLFLLLVLSLALFFRDPGRYTPQDDSLIFSPADGKIIEIKNIGEDAPSPYPATKVSIFLSILNVHITRAPITGIVRSVETKPGRFISAYKESASEKNAHVSVNIQGERTAVHFNQISGSLARRIKSFIKERDELQAGQRIGIIFFGSRVDIFLPKTVDIKVCIGQKVRAGETPIAERTI